MNVPHNKRSHSQAPLSLLPTLIVDNSHAKSNNSVVRFEFFGQCRSKDWGRYGFIVLKCCRFEAPIRLPKTTSAPCPPSRTMNFCNNLIRWHRQAAAFLTESLNIVKLSTNKANRWDSTNPLERTSKWLALIRLCRQLTKPQRPFGQGFWCFSLC